MSVADSKTWKMIRGYFIAGLAVLTPLYFTGWVLYTIFDFFDRLSRNLCVKVFNLEVFPYGLGVPVTITILILAGMFARNFIGGHVLKMFENLLLRLPIANKVYGATKQIVDSFVGKEKAAFEKVVLIKFPHQQGYAIGFLTQGQQIHFPDQNDLPRLYCVFVPTTPNPTSGFLLFLPEAECRFLDMSVEDGLKMVISGGVVVPDCVRGDPPSIITQPVPVR